MLEDQIKIEYQNIASSIFDTMQDIASRHQRVIQFEDGTSVFNELMLKEDPNLLMPIALGTLVYMPETEYEKRLMMHNIEISGYVFEKDDDAVWGIRVSPDPSAKQSNVLLMLTSLYGASVFMDNILKDEQSKIVSVNLVATAAFLHQNKVFGEHSVTPAELFAKFSPKPQAMGG